MQKEFFKGVCFLSCFLYFIFFIVINAGAQKSFSVKIKNPNYSIKIIPAASNTFGYTISKDNGIMIRQPTIPGMPGLVGFRLKADAQKVAALVISKLSRGMMPPTIEKKEMDSLRIHY